MNLHMSSYSCDRWVQHCIVSTIDGPSYRAMLPEMSEQSWNSISDADHSEGRRLEWVGDSALAGRLCMKVYEMFPDGEVDFYSLLRSYVLSNRTFNQLIHKIDTDGSIPLTEGKISADVFEMVVGAFYKEKVHQDREHEFHDWFDNTFTPLIHAADAAFRGWRASSIIVAGALPAPPRKKATVKQIAVQAVKNYRRLRSKRTRHRLLSQEYIPSSLPLPLRAPTTPRHNRELPLPPPSLLPQPNLPLEPRLTASASFVLPSAEHDDKWYLRPLPKISTVLSPCFTPTDRGLHI
ncbi:hypothetical protein C8R46DRAFT_1348745 [Mycena filopes]|nr:hypothetical protein C8R46DRAFT_1348745 [Mycena filopes]